MPNLNASLLGGKAASAFATLGSNTFSGSQTVNGNIGATGSVAANSAQIAGNGLNVLIGNVGCPSGTAGIQAGNMLVNCQNFALRLDGNNNSTHINRPSGGGIFFTEGNGSPQMTINPGGGVNIAAGLVVQPATDFVNGFKTVNIVGGVGNSVTSGFGGATIAGGGNLSGGGNSVTNDYGTVGGGTGNTASGFGSTVSGGQSNTASGFDSTVSGGQSNTASETDSTVGGGENNTAIKLSSTVGGGFSNTASGLDSTVPGGDTNTASGRDSFAAGNHAQATDDGSFVWCATNGATCGSLGTNSFTLSMLGPFTFFVGSGGNGCRMNPGDSGLTCSSDRNIKENYAAIEPKDILLRLIRMPIQQWNMEGAPASMKHIGPVAQDFYAAFGLGGNDDRHISQGDAQGVALAAIQGLYQVVQEKSRAIQQLQHQSKAIQQLRRERDKLAQTVEQLQARMTVLENRAKH